MVCHPVTKDIQSIRESWVLMMSYLKQCQKDEIEQSDVDMMEYVKWSRNQIKEPYRA